MESKPKPGVIEPVSSLEEIQTGINKLDKTTVVPPEGLGERPTGVGAPPESLEPTKPPEPKGVKPVKPNKNRPEPPPGDRPTQPKEPRTDGMTQKDIELNKKWDDYEIAMDKKSGPNNQSWNNYDTEMNAKTETKEVGKNMMKKWKILVGKNRSNMMKL